MAACLVDTDVSFKNANYNEKAEFGLLTNAFMEHMCLAQYVFLRGASVYDSLMRMVQEDVYCREIFSQAYMGKRKEEHKQNHALTALCRP